MKKWVLLGMAAALAVDIYVVMTHRAHGHFNFENLPAAGAVFGFFFAVAVVAASRFLGSVLVKKEDYYD
jgi:hypothetical protein